MKYGEISGNHRINTMIYRCFDCIAEEDVRVFVRKFHQQAKDEDQVIHTFRELVLGAFLASSGFTVQYERPIGPKTPDWTIIDERHLPTCIVELVNFHPDATRDREIKQQLNAGNVWCGFPSNVDRLYSRIQEKAAAYKAAVEQADVPCIVSLFGDFFAVVEHHEIRTCLFEKGTELFALYPEMSGLLFFQHGNGYYHFTYESNPVAARAFSLPSGQF
ncbi:MAG: hypothetical protein ACHRHE_06895 [Tepidisphaerales bacterium]